MRQPQGFRSIINNRRDGEAEEQPRNDDLAAAAERLGPAYRHIPAVSGKVTDRDAEAFAQALAEVRGPVLAFCQRRRPASRANSRWRERKPLGPQEQEGLVA